MADTYFVEIESYPKTSKFNTRNLRLNGRAGLYVKKIKFDVFRDGKLVSQSNADVKSGKFSHTITLNNGHYKLEVFGVNSKGQRKVVKHYGLEVAHEYEEKSEPPRENALTGFYPKGEIVDVGMPVRWNNKPRGLVVHFTAGWSNKESNAVRTLQGGKKNGYTYWSMSESGKIYMDTKATEHGYHAGHSAHRDHIGLEICNGGKLKNGKTWFGYRPPADRVRYFSDGLRNWHNGEYMTYTTEQEKSLIDVCLWLKSAYPDTFSFDRVVGHHELTPDHKSDPCGALSMSMNELRELLKNMFAEMKGNT